MSQNFIWTVNTICILLQVIYLETFFIYPSFYSKDMLSSLSSFGKVLKCWNNYIIYTVIMKLLLLYLSEIVMLLIMGAPMWISNALQILFYEDI